METADRLSLEEFSVIGAGAAGSVLSRALCEAGLVARTVISRDPEAARRLAATIGARASSDRLEALAGEPTLLILAVPDDVLPGMASALCQLNIDWKGWTVVHLSGAVPAAVLDPLRERGAEVMSFHPMLALHGDAPSGVFLGARVNVEGSEGAIGSGRVLAERIGALPHVTDAETKAMIHLVASVASNYLVTLMSIAADLLERSGIEAQEKEELLRPLVMKTLAGLGFADPARGLTGPIARGDRETLRRQLELIERTSPDYSAVLAALAAETVRIAARRGGIDGSEGAEMLDLLHRFVESHSRSI